MKQIVTSNGGSEPLQGDLPSEGVRRGLHVRRPQPSGADSSERTHAAVRQVEARANAEWKRVRAKRLRAYVNNVVAIVLLAAIGFGVYKAYRIWKGYDEKVELPSIVESIVEKLRKE